LALCFTIDSLFQSLIGWYAVEYPVFRPSDYESPFDHVMIHQWLLFFFLATCTMGRCTIILTTMWLS